MYHICWISRETGIEGGGYALLSLALADELVRWLNTRCPELWHYIVPEQGFCR